MYHDIHEHYYEETIRQSRILVFLSTKYTSDSLTICNSSSALVSGGGAA